MCNHYFFTVIFMLHYSTFVITGVINSPVIYQNDEVILQNGEELSLSCSGNKPLNWTFQNDKNPKAFNITYGNDENNTDYPFWSNLTILNATYINSGFYYCHFNWTKYMEESANATSVYVYVFDENHLLLPTTEDSKFNFVAVHETKQMVIPCRPTHPEVNVTLIKRGLTMMNVPEEYGVEYVPTEGFRLKSPNKFFNGLFQCKAQYFNITEYLDFHFSYFFDTAAPPNPIIEAQGNQHVVINSTFHLVCKVSAEPSAFIFMKWTYPDSVNTQRVNVSYVKAIKRKNQNGKEIREYSIVITVTETQFTDQGIYKCTAQDHTRKTGFTQTFVQVYNSPWRLNLTTDIKEQMELYAGEEKAVFVVTVDAFPKPTITWIKNNKILTSDKEKYEISSTTNSNSRTRLLIKNLEKSDSGIYTVVATNIYSQRKLSISLLVLAPPIISSSTSVRLANYNGSVTISCSATGNPLPNIRWHFAQMAVDLDANMAEFSPIGKGDTEANNPIINENSIDTWTQSSELKLIATKSGIYKCVAENNVSNVAADIPLIVVEIKDGISIEVSKGDPVESQNFSLTCGASKHLYKGLKWTWQPSDKQLIDHSKDMIASILQETSSNNTIFAKLIFTQLTQFSNGRYICEAIVDPANQHFNAVLKQYANDNTVRFYDMKVKEMKIPIYIYTALNGSKVEVKPNERYELMCNSSGLSCPILKWMRNNKVIDRNQIFQVEFRHHDSTLVIPHFDSRHNGRYTCTAEN